MKKLVTVLVIALTVTVSKAQDFFPVNSNYLIDLGISPRVLDFAANSTLQDGSFKEHVSITLT
ncbi:MAG: hypothetical protein ACR2PH_03210, partial [Desulfobulbia bacterium]